MNELEFIGYMPKIYHQDPFTIALSNAVKIELDKLYEKKQKVYNNLFINTLDEEYGIPMFLDLLDLTAKDTSSTEEKRAMISAKLKSKGKSKVEILQNVANSWKNGEVNVDFDDLIKITFLSIGGIPSDLDSLKNAINIVKPAYLLVEYIFNWLYWDMFDSWDLTWDELDSKNLTWDELEATINKP